MTDKTDPLAGLDRHRAAVLALLMTRESNPWMDRWVEAALAAADAADRAAGIVRVDTCDEALVERAAVRAYLAAPPVGLDTTWAAMPERQKDRWRGVVQAVVDTYREAAQ